MRHEPNLRAESHRQTHPFLGGSPHGSNMGYFVIGPLRVISGGIPEPDEPPWEHVSVSLPSRCPTWEEMCRIKDIFWNDDEPVIQFHPPKSDYKNLHLFCLHLWRRTDQRIELPPTYLVAP